VADEGKASGNGSKTSATDELAWKSLRPITKIEIVASMLIVAVAGVYGVVLYRDSNKQGDPLSGIYAGLMTALLLNAIIGIAKNGFEFLDKMSGQQLGKIPWIRRMAALCFGIFLMLGMYGGFRGHSMYYRSSAAKSRLDQMKSHLARLRDLDQRSPAHVSKADPGSKSTVERSRPICETEWQLFDVISRDVETLLENLYQQRDLLREDNESIDVACDILFYARENVCNRTGLGWDSCCHDLLRVGSQYILTEARRYEWMSHYCRRFNVGRTN
jgi:hypothetical protein